MPSAGWVGAEEDVDLVVEDGVEDERAPADEEDGGDAAQENVSALPAAIYLLMLTRGPENR